MFKLAISLSVLVVSLYVIGVIARYRDRKSWLIPNAKYFMNIFKSVSFIYKAIMGVSFPRSLFSRTDKYYYSLTKPQFDKAHTEACELMIGQGWQMSNYHNRSNDCDDYAMKKCIEIRHAIFESLGGAIGDKGIGVGMAGYTRRDGKGHMIIYYIDRASGIQRFFEPYAEYRFRGELILTRDELESIVEDIM